MKAIAGRTGMDSFISSSFLGCAAVLKSRSDTTDACLLCACCGDLPGLAIIE
jgi:hypothetical protein